jgi:NitT/TauT family transport system ATP-binding protein
MTQPDVDHALPGREQPVASSNRGAKKYQMLPHARPGGIAGLLELLHDRGGRDDIYRLAEPLAMDVDDLLPIIESATMLGFATLKDGDVEVTPEGVAFVEADILNRKVLFREAVLKHVAILQCIDSVLRAKSDHSIPEEFYRYALGTLRRDF